MTRQKRKAMELDSSEGCQSCGILFVSVHRHGKKELCRACKCAEMAELASQTPCGQQYCKLCGILIEPMVPQVYEPDYCSACTLRQSIFIRPEDFSKAVGTCCKCEFCSNDRNISMSPPERKFMKQSLKPTAETMKERTSSSEKTSGGPFEHLVEEELRNKWEREQLSLKERLVARDSPVVKTILQAIRSKSTSKTFYIGGVDISFIKDNSVDACAALVVISFPDLKVRYKRLEMIQLTAPYIPGFLAFREVDSLIRLYNSMLSNAPQYKPDVIFVDGNGQLHPRGFGLACHLGVLLDLPCVGVAKTLIHVDGIEENAEHKAKKQTLKGKGDTFPLTTDSGKTLGKALRSTDAARNPVYVSVGHRICLQSAVTLVQHCCKYRIPEPTRSADLYSRQYLMDQKHAPEELIVED